MSDEAKLLSPQEARLKRKVREISQKETPKTFVTIKRQSDEDHFNKTKPRRYSATVGTKVRGEHISKAGVTLKYDPLSKEIKVGEIYPIRIQKKTVEDPFKPFREQHPEVRNTVLPRAAVKRAVERTAMAFPKAEKLIGDRMTGIRTKEGIDTLQKFNLRAVRKRLAKAGKLGKALGLGLAAYEAYKGSE